jgi:hypothetical protein
MALVALAFLGWHSQVDASPITITNAGFELPKKLITLPSMEAAHEQGYIPCPVCRPHKSDETH